MASKEFYVRYYVGHKGKFGKLSYLLSLHAVFPHSTAYMFISPLVTVLNLTKWGQSLCHQKVTAVDKRPLSSTMLLSWFRIAQVLCKSWTCWVQDRRWLFHLSVAGHEFLEFEFRPDGQVHKSNILPFNIITVTYTLTLFSIALTRYNDCISWHFSLLCQLHSGGCNSMRMKIHAVLMLSICCINLV